MTGATAPGVGKQCNGAYIDARFVDRGEQFRPGGDIGSGPPARYPVLTVSAGNSLVETVCGTCNVSVSGTGNRLAVDPLLGPLAFNGGPTRTHACKREVRRSTGSNPLGLTTDQRGIGFARVVGAAADMGAYEAVIGPSITLALTSPLVGITRTINGTVTLSQPAPAGGVAVSLASGNPSLVTVAPSSVTIAAGGTTAPFTVTGVALGGPITITGSGAGFAWDDLGHRHQRAGEPGRAAGDRPGAEREPPGESDGAGARGRPDRLVRLQRPFGRDGRGERVHRGGADDSRRPIRR